MKERIPLQVVEGRIILSTIINNTKLRISHHFVDFVIDTGSQDSFLSQKDVAKLQIPIADRSVIGEVDFGGSRYKQVNLPPFDVHLLKEDKKPISISVPLTAVKTTKTSPKKIAVASTLPSILGTDFLKSQKLSLHVILTEDLAYLQIE